MGQAIKEAPHRSNPCMPSPVGIIGAGHLGRALAQLLLQHGLTTKDLMISYQGSAATAESLRTIGLLDCARSNEAIALDAKTLFLTLRPRAVDALAKLRPRAESTISCMAGVSIARLRKILQCPEVTRIMPSGPETILQGRGIAAVFPANGRASALLVGLGLRVFDLAEEGLLHWFTVGVCLPAALLAAPPDAAVDAAADTVSAELPCFVELLVWARRVVPTSTSVSEREQYIQAMATAGGVTEAIVTSLRSGSTFLEALTRGHQRSNALAQA